MELIQNMYIQCLQAKSFQMWYNLIKSITANHGTLTTMLLGTGIPRYAFYTKSYTLSYDSCKFRNNALLDTHTGQETLISQASKSLWIRRQALNIMVSMKLSILLPKYINFNESAGFYSVECSPDVYHTIYLMKIPRETLV